MKKDELAFYKFQPDNVIGSIGAQCCNWESAYTATSDSVIFFLEDIDSDKLNFKQAQAAWDYYASLRGKPMTSLFQILIGDEMATHLPDNIFDKIIIINSFHEFSMKKEMFSDIKKKLKKGGILYIDEALPKKPGQLHGICNLPMLTSKETIDFIEENGFEFVSIHKFTFSKKIPV